MRKSGLAIIGSAVAAALGLAAWTGASAEMWAGVTLLTECGVLMLAAIGAVCRTSDERPQLAGYAVFGWGYFALARWYSYYEGPMPTVRWLPGAGEIHNDILALTPDVRIAHDAWALAFAVLGSILARFLVKHSSTHEHEHANEMLASGGPTGWWRGPAFVGLLSFGAMVIAAVLADGSSEPEIWAGAAFLLAWALAGLAILGAVCARGRRREAWIGAASFGVGYLILAFGPVVTMELPTNHFLNAIFRPGAQTRARDRLGDELAHDAESQRVCRALREPIEVHFPKQTPLKLVLDHIKNAIQGPLGKELVVFAGSEEWASLSTVIDKRVVTIDRANIPAEEALRLCLGQIGLTYRVHSGYVRIVPDAYQPLPFEEDPVMIVGHSLLALCAGGFGGISALLVACLLGRHKER
jgi:hypothetical protein